MKNLKKSKLSPFPKEVYERNSGFYKVMANAKRLEILNILKNREISVNDLAKAVGMRVPNTSQHLSVLKAYRLVKTRHDGQTVYYSIVSSLIVEPCRILKNLAPLLK